MKHNNNSQGKHSEEAALAWIAKLRSDAATEQDREAFALWLGEDNSHMQAMDQALELWDDLGVVRRLPAGDDLPEKAANSRRWLPAAMAIAASLMLAVVLWPPLAGDPASTRYQTAMGERLEVKLPDGSLAVLNTDTALTVTYADDQRLIDLARGEAWFKVQTNSDKPFHVDSGDARVTALGTAFNVYRHEDATSITVTEGVVRVSELGETGARAPTVEVLRESQHLLTGRQGWDISTPDLEQSMAWRSGQLIAREMPLPELLTQLQRYSAMDILVTDPAIAALTVSGVFELDQPEATLRALALSLGLQAETLDSETVQLLKTGQ